MMLSYIPPMRSKQQVIKAIEFAQQTDPSPAHRLSFVMVDQLNTEFFTEPFESFSADNFIEAVAKFTMRRYQYLADFMDPAGEGITQDEYNKQVEAFAKVEDILLDVFADHLDDGGGSVTFSLNDCMVEAMHVS